ncbi:RagB/SusD family nutrient uptake outer membrane protein [Pedobacter panaciterrae]|uniref:RagB/SusD family nutrient uptake outer membrane protein n=1 Tax=Pedobacter panaciterrae TaxID=363849 RepID=UPI00155D8FAF|nr:RagB/SusD family nutrient uptake outer membrane protein [Pedobacter panaciterrae]NQX56898.1 RagB/SusD family nutrient uptake outer membrane protein [Pedobacter panaciterrae]
MKSKDCLMLLLLSLSLINASCKKLIDVDGPETSLTSRDIYNNDETALGAVTSLYAKLSQGQLGGPGELTSLSNIAGLSSDELDYFSLAGSPTLNAYYQNQLNDKNVGIDYWNISYQRLFVINAAIEGLTASTETSESLKKQLLGEVKFMRGFYYFYLVNLYGDVPLILTTDYTVNSVAKKTAKLQVYQQVLSDLKDAQNLLSSQYLRGDGMTPYPNGLEERVRPTKWAATALLARTYLYLKDWSNAEIESSKILLNTEQFHIVSIDEVFLKNNKEAIWQLQPVTRGANTAEAITFVLPPSGPSFLNPVYLSERVMDAFALNDRRKTEWTGHVNTNGILYNYPYKYKVAYSTEVNYPVIEFSVVFRLAEQLLIRAEARTHIGNKDGAIADVDIIRERAGLSSIKTTNSNVTVEDLATIILNERRVEFFAEWGHRWLDLKRTEKVGEIMNIVTPKKSNGSSWKTFQQYYPISLNELKADPNLVQVPGY